MGWDDPLFSANFNMRLFDIRHPSRDALLNSCDFCNRRICTRQIDCAAKVAMDAPTVDAI